MPENKVKSISQSNGQPSNGELDSGLADAVNQLVWLIADEFVDEYSSEMWLREALPEPQKPKTRTAGGS